MGDATGTVTARHDPSLVARVVRRVPMRYAGGADPALDRPAHVRAASGLAWVPDARRRIAVVQDDASFVALVDPATGEAEAVVLPSGEGGRRQFDDGRGNKAHKLDLEALARIDDDGGAFLLAFGSGSSPRREAVLVLERVEPRRAPAGHDLVPRLVHAPRFYAALRERRDFAGSELNVEGVLQLGDRLRLFQRGNGAPKDGREPVNATCDVALQALLEHLATPDAVAPPAPSHVVRYDLGAIRGTRLSFTDATLAPAGARAETILYTATAEASPDAVRDGDVAGSAIGVLDAGGGARWTALRDADGPIACKVEGIVPDPAHPGRVFVVLDVDAHDRPSELCEVALEGRWASG